MTNIDTAQQIQAKVLVNRLTDDLDLALSDYKLLYKYTMRILDQYTITSQKGE